MPNSTVTSAPRSRSLGFSLGGIIATLAVVALIAGVSIPAFFARHAVTLDNAAILLARDLRSVQNRAAHLGQATTLRFDPLGWRAFDASGQPLNRFGGTEPIERRLDADAVFEGVTIESLHMGDRAQVVFDAAGRPDRGGSLEVVYRGQRRLVRVSPTNGRVSVEGLERGWVDDGL